MLVRFWMRQTERSPNTSNKVRHEKKRLHTYRAAGCDCDHRDLGGHTIARVGARA